MNCDYAPLRVWKHVSLRMIHARCRALVLAVAKADGNVDSRQTPAHVCRIRLWCILYCMLF